MTPQRARLCSTTSLIVLLLLICPGAAAWAQSIAWNDALDQEAHWYGGAEAIRIADNVLLYQHETGGWPKNIDMARVLDEADRARIRQEQAEGGTTLSNITIDNGATYSQMRYLARVYEATGLERFREGVLRGLEYLRAAQYDNGGWPQYYPLREGYYERITFNDNAIIGALSVLRDIAAGEPPFAFAEAEHRTEAEAAVDRGIDLILRTQIRQNGRLTAWCAQYDEETLQPAWGRDYEPPSLSGAESVGVVRFLMSLGDPSPAVVKSVEGAATWFRDVAIFGYRYERFVDAEGHDDRKIVPDSDAGPLWARFYELVTNRPLFLGRDSVFRYALAEIEQERRSGYSYYGSWARQLLEEEYPAWRSRHGLPEPGALNAHTAAPTRDYPLQPVPFNEVELIDDFWLPRLHTQREVLVPHAFDQTERGLQHLQAAADHLAGREVEHDPHRYIDSDLYKVMEGAAYLLQLEHDPVLEARMDSVVGVIAAAQTDDGYLYPSHITGVGTSDHFMGDAPYEFVVHSHELYNMGHLYEAAVAYYRATGKDELLKVAEKNARHVNRVFFEGDPRYNDGEPVEQAPGHEEIELALVKLYRVTGDSLYLQMADRFLDMRGETYRPDGQGVMSPTYAQQHAPVEEQTEPTGHAVRAAYLYAAMADVSALTGKTAYAAALDAIWQNIVDTRMHITGGLGAVHGIEGFGDEYELPNKEAYNETCAAVGNVLVNHRMFLLHGDAKYLDVAEVALLNNVLAGVNLAGNRFFYVNPLEADGEHEFNHGALGRKEWFGTACCPTNLARLIPQVSGMLYAHRGDSLYLTFYAGSESTVELGGGRVHIQQQTAYPREGTVFVTLTPEHARDFTVKLRIPTWTRDRFLPGALYRYVDDVPSGFTVRVNGEAVEAPLEKGFAVVDRRWRPGDRIELELPMPARFSTSDERVEANRGRVAVTRGPLVMAAEEADNGVVQRLAVGSLPKRDEIAVGRLEIAEGYEVVNARLPGARRSEDGPVPTTVSLIPYYAWNNRGDGSMIVWMEL